MFLQCAINSGRLANTILALLLLVVYAKADAQVDTISFILAEQGRHSAEISNCTYKVSVSGQISDDNRTIPISTNAAVTLVGATGIVTKEHNVVNEYPDGTSSIDREVQRVVCTKNLIVDWPDVSRAEVNIYPVSDGKTESAMNRKVFRDTLETDPLLASYYLGDDGSLADSYEKTRDSSTFSWTVSSELDINGNPVSFTVTRKKTGERRPDLTVKIDPTRDFVITASIFEPYGASDSYKRTYKKEYCKVADSWLMSSCELTTTTGNGSVEDSVMTKFGEFKLLTPSESPEITLANLELPSRALVYKRDLIKANGLDLAPKVMELRDGNLISVSDISSVMSDLGLNARN